MKHKKIILSLIVLVVIVLGLTLFIKSRSQPGKLLETPYVVQTTTMGTTVSVTDYTPGKEVEEAAKNSLKIAENYNTWTTVNQAGSIVDKINKNAGTGQPVKVSDQIFSLIQDAYNLSDQGTGYDVTVGPLTQLWHIGFPNAKLPSQSEIKAVLPLINYQYLKLDEKEKTVYLTQKGAQLDLGSIVKGYTCKLMTAYLRAHGMTCGVVNLGNSSLYVMGESPQGKNSSWNVSITDPNNPTGANLGVVTVKNQFLSTSGIYERFLTVKGKTYSHILNPQTGYPFDNDIQGVTIIGSSDATYGDGVSTTIFALGTKKGYDYVLDHHLQAIFVDKDNKIYITPGLKDKFVVNSKSKYHLFNISSLKGNG